MLSEVRRVARPGAAFCFSTHNLLAIRSLLHGRPWLNPLNVLRDGPTELTTYYARPGFQRASLEAQGFVNIRAFGLNGAELPGAGALERNTDDWIYYLCEVP